MEERNSSELRVSFRLDDSIDKLRWSGRHDGPGIEIRCAKANYSPLYVLDWQVCS